MREFKIGDKVKVINKPWGSSLGVDGKIGTIKGIYNGKIGTIEGIYRGVVLLIQFKEGANCWIEAHNVELLSQSPSIHITTDGTEIYAILKENGKVVKKSVAKYSKDEFDFETGVKFAIDRLFKEKKEESNFSVVFGNDGDVIIKKGKVYDFVNGYTIWDSGDKSLKYDNFDDLKKCMGDWKPFKIKKVNRVAKDGEYVQFTTRSTRQYGNIYRAEKGFYNHSKQHLYAYNLECGLLCYIAHRDYVVLEGYEKYIEYIEEKKKAEFKPYLTFDGLSDFYGNIGDETSQVDVLGNRLKVGDTVKLYYGKTFKGESPIVRSNNRDFVMGLCGTVFFNGKAEDWTIIKNRSYEEVKDGEIVGNIKYIKTIQKSNN